MTAKFNRNVLHVLNRELDADFASNLRHVAFFDREHEWIEMRLRATASQRLAGGARPRVDFAACEELRTEISAKFTPERLHADLDASGLELVEMFTDPTSCSP